MGRTPTPPPPKEVAPSPPHPIPQCRCTFLLGIKGQRLSFLPFWAFGLGEGGAFEGGGCSWAGEVVQRLPWGGFCCMLGCRLEPPRPREPVKRIPCFALRTGGEGHPQGQRVFSKEKELDAWSSLVSSILNHPLQFRAGAGASRGLSLLCLTWHLQGQN